MIEHSDRAHVFGYFSLFFFFLDHGGWWLHLHCGLFHAADVGSCSGKIRPGWQPATHQGEPQLPSASGSSHQSQQHRWHRKHTLFIVHEVCRHNKAPVVSWLSSLSSFLICVLWSKNFCGLKTEANKTKVKPRFCLAGSNCSSSSEGETTPTALHAGICVRQQSVSVKDAIIAREALSLLVTCLQLRCQQLSKNHAGVKVH